jgi:hypothetical protein
MAAVRTCMFPYCYDGQEKQTQHMTMCMRNSLGAFPFNAQTHAHEHTTGLRKSFGAPPAYRTNTSSQPAQPSKSAEAEAEQSTHLPQYGIHSAAAQGVLGSLKRTPERGMGADTERKILHPASADEVLAKGLQRSFGRPSPSQSIANRPGSQKVQEAILSNTRRRNSDSEMSDEMSGKKHNGGTDAGTNGKSQETKTARSRPSSVVVRHKDGTLELLARGLSESLEVARTCRADVQAPSKDASNTYSNLFATGHDIRAHFDADNVPDEAYDPQENRTGDDEMYEMVDDDDEDDGSGAVRDRSGRILTDTSLSVRQESKLDFPQAYRSDPFTQKIDGTTCMPVEDAFPEYFEHGGGLIAHGNPWEHSATVSRRLVPSVCCLRCSALIRVSKYGLHMSGHVRRCFAHEC